MKVGDTVRLETVKPNHNKRLQRRLGKEGEIVARDTQGYFLVRFGEEIDQWWVQGRHLAVTVDA